MTLSLRTSWNSGVFAAVLRVLGSLATGHRLSAQGTDVLDLLHGNATTDQGHDLVHATLDIQAATCLLESGTSYFAGVSC